jgi:two-component system chemotaxis response regulator CheB
MSDLIRVVVVDDSPSACRLMLSYLQTAPGVQVVGTALQGTRAVKVVKDVRPNVVTLDLEMPGMDGLVVLDQIMYECPTPVVVVSGVSQHAASLTLAALDMGAVDCIAPFPPAADTNTDALRLGIVAKIRAASQIHVIRSLRLRKTDIKTNPPLVGTMATPPMTGASAQTSRSPRPARVVVLGASTGGPTALRDLLRALPAHFSAAILIVQHLPESFTAVLAAQLHQQVALTVREAAEGDYLKPGVALVAPGGSHLLLGPDACVHLTKEPEVAGHRPSIDVTMQSVAQVYGARAQGVVLTGMGADGAMGLAAIHAQGGTTFAQDAASCVVNGMPQRAIDVGAVDHVDTPAQIARRLLLTSWQPGRDETW